jgi:hypothetical protein
VVILEAEHICRTMQAHEAQWVGKYLVTIIPLAFSMRTLSSDVECIAMVVGVPPFGGGLFH